MRFVAPLFVALLAASPSSAMIPPVIAQAATIAGPGDASKGMAVSDLDDGFDKLPLRAKVKSCCGFPVGDRGSYRLSFYWLAYESEYANEKYDTDIYDRMGDWLGRYPSAFVFELRLEGTGILRDGRVLNYDGDCKYGIGTCFKVLAVDEAPQGRGVQGRPLVPFRSVAVDPRYIPIGSTIYVPEIVGMILPDGTRHDGCLRADDQGGAIKLRKLDFFVESYENFKFLADQQWWRMTATPYLDEPRCEYLRLGDPREYDNEKTDWLAIHTAKYKRAIARALRFNAHRRRMQLAEASHSRRKHGALVATKHHGKHQVLAERTTRRKPGGHRNR